MSEQRDEWMKKPEHDREQHAISLVVDAASGEKGKFSRWLAEHDRQVAARAWGEGRDAGAGYQRDHHRFMDSGMTLPRPTPPASPYQEGA